MNKFLQEVDRRNREWMKQEKSPVGDYMTYYNQVKREIKYSKPVYKNISKRYG